MSDKIKAACADLGVEYRADGDGLPTVGCWQDIEKAICLRAFNRLVPLVAAAGDDSLDADFKYLMQAYARLSPLAWDQEFRQIEAALSQHIATWAAAQKRRKFTDADYDREAALSTSKKDLARRLEVNPVTLSRYEAKRFRETS